MLLQTTFEAAFILGSDSEIVQNRPHCAPFIPAIFDRLAVSELAVLAAVQPLA